MTWTDVCGMHASNRYAVKLSKGKVSKINGTRRENYCKVGSHQRGGRVPTSGPRYLVIVSFHIKVTK